MTWEYVKGIIGELEEIILKTAAAISLCLFIIEILTRKISEIIKGWKK